MPNESRNAKLAGLLGDRQAFDRFILGALPDDLAAALAGVIAELDAAALTETERDTRFRRVWNKAFVAVSDFEGIAHAARDARSRVLRNAVTEALPRSLRKLVYGRPVAEAALQAAPDVRAFRSRPTPVESPIAQLPFASTLQRTSASDVLVLTLGDAEAAWRLLQSKDFAMHRIATISELETMLRLNGNICAFIAEKSFLESLDLAAQRSLVKLVAAYSSFSFIWLSGSGLRLTHVDLGPIVARARCSTREPGYLALRIADTDTLQAADLDYVARARSSLDVVTFPSFFLPSDVDDAELRLLAAAIACHAAERHYSGTFALDSLRTKFLSDGLSGARVALVRFNDYTFPSVVKIDRPQQVVAEAQRFLTFVLPHLPEHVPAVHLHHNSGLIIFDVIGTSEIYGGAPAPTLATQLSSLWYDEMAGRPSASTHDTLLRAFSQATSRLRVINGIVPATHFVSKANPYIHGVKEMEERGFHWGFGDTALAARARSEKLVATHQLSAICHGDAHTRNVLIRRDQGYLIDYAYSGPGHPAADLVRLELSVFFTAFHPFGDESAWKCLQFDLTTTQTTAESLIVAYPSLFASQVNRTCIRMCVEARDVCLGVLGERGLRQEQYTAVKLLSAWQSLQVPTLQQRLVRTVIDSLSVAIP